MRARMQTGIDADLLQADVMRFMAIIAFCLIAILALVRNIDAPVIAETVPEPKLEPVIEAPVPEPPSPATAAPAPQPVAQKMPVIKTAPEPTPAFERPAVTTPKPVPALTPIRPAAAPVEPATVALAPTPAPAPIEAPQPVAPAPSVEPKPEPKEERGLSLRFVSDQDFLRLISKREITVFLFNDQAAHRLSPQYTFEASKPPRQVYEVLAETIPATISRAARRDLGDITSLRWGIAMPPPIERQIADYVAAATDGELVIDRYGKVRHVD